LSKHFLRGFCQAVSKGKRRKEGNLCYPIEKGGGERCGG